MKPSPRRAFVVIGVVVILGSLFYLLLGGFGDYGARYTAVSLMGGLIGVGELVSRYRDRPVMALATFPAVGYVLINAAASAGALGAILTFGWTFGLDPATDHEAVVATQLLVAGFGAMALFRSSLFTVRVGDKTDVGIGPSSLLSIILVACDRGVDRTRATDRAEVVGKIMSDVSFVSAVDPLPTVAIALMQNLEGPDQAALSVEVERLRNDKTGMSDKAKSLLLGLAISNAVGPHVLDRAKDLLGTEVTAQPPTTDPLTAEVARLVEQTVSWPTARTTTSQKAETVTKAEAIPEPPGNGAKAGTPTPPSSAQDNGGSETPLAAPSAQDRGEDPGLPQTPQTPSG